jgi:Arc/MetJ-type ribon-helix-helix transcriptional regulator
MGVGKMVDVKIPKKLLEDMSEFVGEDKDFLDIQEMIREASRRLIDHLKNVEAQRRHEK